MQGEITIELFFWIYFFTINLFFFSPRFILEIQESTFFPINLLKKESLIKKIEPLKFRHNYDVFRCCIDLVIFVVIVFFLKGTIYFSPLLTLGLFIFPILFIYSIYWNAFERIYTVTPLFYNDINLLSLGLDILKESKWTVKIMLILGLSLVLLILLYLVNKLAYTIQIVNFHAISYALFFILIAGSLFSMFRYKYAEFPRPGFQFITRSIYQNIVLTLGAKKNLKWYDIKKLKNHNFYSDIDFIKKPNLHVFFIESYGSVLLNHPDLSNDYRRYLNDYNKSLKEKGWYTSSNLSISPVKGGSSWLSYSSVLYGFKIKEQGTYLTLLNEKKISEYESLFRLLINKGYFTYRLASIGGYEKMRIPWDAMSNFYAINQWIKNKDLDYSGKKYGLGPSPPDQYALNCAYEKVKSQNKEPYAFFFLNMNSHIPFDSPKTIVEDWRVLNSETVTEKKASEFVAKPDMKNYAKSIKYQFEYLTKFVMDKGGKNDIFILIGDHQPPLLTNNGEGLETPIHIISQIENFNDGFLPYNFQEGLEIKNQEHPIKHEGFFSLFMQVFTLNFGSKYSKIPTYRPNGIEISKDV